MSLITVLAVTHLTFYLPTQTARKKFIEVKPQSKIADEDFRARFVEKSDNNLNLIHFFNHALYG
jgi:hypothetical protein